MTFLTINDGKIRIYADIADYAAPASFVTDRAYEAARWLFDHKIDEWMGSSSMDFGTEYGWPTDSVTDDITAAMIAISSAARERRKNS